MNIPKKLNLMRDWDTDTMRIYSIQDTINELIDYLQAKEEASKSSWHTFWSYSEKCVCCDKTLEELEKTEEASKGECSKCGCEYPIHKGDCPELYPPEHEESIEDKYYELIMEVGKKYPGETRHQTALRYIRQAENNNNKPAKAGLGD